MSDSAVLRHSWKSRIRKRRGRSLDSVSTRELNLVAMMDMMTIILVFLLKSYSGSALSVEGGDSLRFAASTNDIVAEDALKLTVTKLGGEQPAQIIVDETVVLSLDAGTLQKLQRQAKSKGQNAYLIPELGEVLVKNSELEKLLSQDSEREFEGKILVIADKETPYWLVTQVLFTSAKSGYDKYNLVALKKNQ